MEQMGSPYTCISCVRYTRQDKERVLTCDTKAATYLLEARYQDVRIRNGNFNYQANSTGIMFNPGSYMECALGKTSFL